MQIIPIRASRPALAPVPQLLPSDMDELLDRRAEADRLTTHAIASGQDLSVIFPQHDFWVRLDALAAQRGQE